MKETLVEWLESTNEYHKKPNSVLLYLHMNKAQDNLYNMLISSKITEKYSSFSELVSTSLELLIEKNKKEAWQKRHRLLIHLITNIIIKFIYGFVKLI